MGVSIGFCLLCSGCRYHPVNQEEKITLSIPYIQGDKEGGLTTALIFELAQAGIYHYVKGEADVRLQAELVSDEEDIIGFRYDQSTDTSQLLSNLMATENRRKLSFRITLMDPVTQMPILPPQIVTSDAEYDYIDVNTFSELAFIDMGGQIRRTIHFSGGQLDSVEGAQDSALQPIYRDLAKKITALIERAYIETTDAFNKEGF
ncbi:MAG: hypothetical protein QRY72_03920 [Candidatus Rhabdochlamydia sp.]